MLTCDNERHAATLTAPSAKTRRRCATSNGSPPSPPTATPKPNTNSPTNSTSTPSTLYNWRQDRDFRDVWHDEADEVIGDPDRRQAVLETLYRAATDERNPRHVTAAKLYLEAIGAIAPPKLDVTVSGKALGMLDDDELESLIARGVAELRGEPDGQPTSGVPAADNPG